MITFLTVMFALGLTGGFFSGLLGIGGGIIMVPLLLYIPPWLGLATIDMKMAAGITMVQSLAGSLSALGFHRRHRHINQPLVLLMGAGSLTGALIGSVWSTAISGQTMLGIFTGLALVASVLLFFTTQENKLAEDGTSLHFRKIPAVLIGLVVGVLGGIIGQGGAFILIPLMIYILRLPTRIVLGSSVAISFLAALAGFFGKWGTNQIPILPAVIVALGAVAGAQAGGYLSNKVQTATLRSVLGVLIAGTALRTGYTLLESNAHTTVFLAGIGIMAIAILVNYFLRRRHNVDKVKASLRS